MTIKSCSERQKVYIGQTGKSFEESIAEHQKTFEQKTQTSTYTDHLTQCGHKFNSNFKIIHTCENGLK